MTGAQSACLFCEQTEIGFRQTKTPATLGKARHVRIPETRVSIDDGNSLKQPVTELECAFEQTVAVGLNALDKHAVPHVVAYPVSSGIRPSAVEAAERQRAVGATETKGIRDRNIDLRFPCRMRHVIEITLFILVVEIDGRRHHLVA